MQIISFINVLSYVSNFSDLECFERKLNCKKDAKTVMFMQPILFNSAILKDIQFQHFFNVINSEKNLKITKLNQNYIKITIVEI